MGMFRYLRIFFWHWKELTLFFLLAIFPITYENLFQGKISEISVSFSTLLIGLLFTRYFDRLREYEKYAHALRRIHSSLKVWSMPLMTLSGIKWGDQKDWLTKRIIDRKNPRILNPHLFHSIDVSAIDDLPDALGDRNLELYKSSIISLSHTVNDCLNLIVNKLNMREKLRKEEQKEIMRLINHVVGNLDKELPVTNCETEKLLALLDE